MLEAKEFFERGRAVIDRTCNWRGRIGSSVLNSRFGTEEHTADLT
jgi:hypothetical protein